MTAITSRSSVLAIVAESTEGTPVAPSGASQYAALQDGFSIDPAFDVLENAELRSSIGKAKPILGAENPTASGSHYLRHSGVEGTAPNYKMIPKAAFGAEVVASTQYDTVSSSTVLIVKVDTGEGANFQRGQLLLVKDATNGYAIRPVMSVSGDDLTLGFALANAPGSGVNLGKCVLYKVADTGHPVHSLWHYLGNGGARQLLAGARLTSLDIDFTAGDLINMAYSFEGLGYYFNPIEITSATKYIDFTDDDGTYAATVAVGWYKDPYELAQAIQTAMNAANAGETHTVTYNNATGTFKFTCTGTVLSLLWNSGSNTANSIASKIGFSTAADNTGTAATTGYTGSALSWTSPYTPSLDSADPLAAKYHDLMIGDATDYANFHASSVKFSLKNTRKVTPDVTAQSARSGSIITERVLTVSFTALLDKYDVDKFRRYRAGDDTRFFYAFGTRVGGNWVAGKCGGLFLPTATVTKFKIGDSDGLATLEGELQAYVDSSGNGEAYLGFV